jgi:hypothetical protein
VEEVHRQGRHMEGEMLQHHKHSIQSFSILNIDSKKSKKNRRRTE